MKRNSLVFLRVVCIGIAFMLLAYNSYGQRDLSRSFWINADLALLTNFNSRQADWPGRQWGLSANFLDKYFISSFKVSHNIEGRIAELADAPPKKSSFNFDFLAGKYFELGTKHSHKLSIQAGLSMLLFRDYESASSGYSFSYQSKNDFMPGFVFAINNYWSKKTAGWGLTTFGNINKSFTFYGLGLIVQLYSSRNKSDMSNL